MMNDLLGSLYRSLVPGNVRERIYQRHIQDFRARQAAHVAAVQSAIPKVDLAPQHIANLRVLLTRQDLLACLPAAAVVAEIGVAQGEFSREILDIAKPRTLHLIDLWEGRRYGGGRAQVEQRLAQEIAASRVTLHQGYSTEVLATFPDGMFDWLYLDSDHSYAVTAQELAVCERKVRPGGIIAGHDFTRGNWQKHLRYGVIEAVHEFCVARDWELLYLTHEVHGYHSFAIRARM